MPEIQPPTGNYVSQGLHGQYNAVDYGARTSRLVLVMNSKNIYAVEDGKITAYGNSGTMGNRLEITSADGKRRWGMGHLESTFRKVGDLVKRGQLIGTMGNTGLTKPSGYYGTHLHLVCLTGGKYVYPPTLMNKPFSVYVAPAPSKMPPVGSKIKLANGTTRHTFKAGTQTIVGTIRVTDNSFIYNVLGYDSKYPNRIIINSKSAGGNGVALALYYTSGAKIDGWQQI